MAQTVAVVRATLTATGSGTTDFTKASFGTPTAAILIRCIANSTNNPSTIADMSIGFWDGTNQRVVAITANDNLGTSDTTRSSDDRYGITLTQTSFASRAEYTISAVTDGIRATMSVDNTGAQCYCTVILLKGVSADTFTFTPNSTQDAATSKTGLSYAPKLAFFLSIGESSARIGGPSTTTSLMSFGVADVNGTHRLLTFRSEDNSSTEIANIGYSETRCVEQLGADARSWAGEITAWNSDGFTMTTRDAATGSDLCFVLTLGGADLSYDLGTLTTPTSTGNSATSTSVAPDAVLVALSTSTSTTIETGSGANGYMLGMADGSGEFAHNLSVEDGASTTNANSAASASALINLDTSVSGTRTDMIDGTVTLNSADFTVNYSAVDGTARKGWWVAFGEVAATGNPWYQYQQQAIVTGVNV